VGIPHACRGDRWVRKLPPRLPAASQSHGLVPWLVRLGSWVRRSNLTNHGTSPWDSREEGPRVGSESPNNPTASVGDCHRHQQPRDAPACWSGTASPAPLLLAPIWTTQRTLSTQHSALSIQHSAFSSSPAALPDRRCGGARPRVPRKNRPKPPGTAATTPVDPNAVADLAAPPFSPRGSWPGFV